MAWGTELYASAAELKTQLRIADTVDDTAATTAVTAASRAIDHWCNRQFGLTGSAVARYYTYCGESVSGRAAIAIDDLMTTTGLVVAVDLGQDGTYEETLTIDTEFDLWPHNAALDLKPWTALVLHPNSSPSYTYFPRAYRVTANWGWSSVPTVVKQAALIQASRLFVRRDSPYGIAGSPDVGSEMRLLSQLDPDVRQLLGAVKRHWGAVNI